MRREPACEADAETIMVLREEVEALQAEIDNHECVVEE